MLTNSKKRKLYHFSNLINDFIFTNAQKMFYKNNCNNTIYEGVLYHVEKFSNYERSDSEKDFINKLNNVYIKYDNIETTTARSRYAPEIEKKCLFLADTKVGFFLDFETAFKNYKIFDTFNYNISDKQYKKLYKSAQKLYAAFTNKNDFQKESCFISSNSLHGFYFPNLEKIACIVFLDKIPYILYHETENEK